MVSMSVVGISGKARLKSSCFKAVSFLVRSAICWLTEVAISSYTKLFGGDARGDFGF
jgi:hypothetical protein